MEHSKINNVKLSRPFKLRSAEADDVRPTILMPFPQVRCGFYDEQLYSEALYATMVLGACLNDLQ